MSSKTGIVIAVRPAVGEPARKLTKVTEYADGGFAVLTPYHRAREGSVGTVTMVRNKGEEQTIPWSETAFFSASDRVKLSYHKDGFCQFSGEKGGAITSGIDPTTGQAKGVGIKAKPLSDPILSGPAWMLLAWGMNEFDELGANSSSAILFEPGDAYYHQCTPSTANTLMVECLVLSAVHWTGVRRRGDQYVLALAVPQIGRDPRSQMVNVIEWRVMEMAKENILLAFRLSHCKTALPEKAQSGWQLCGPSEPGAADKPVRGLLAWYPPLPSSAHRGSIDREAAPQPYTSVAGPRQPPKK